MLLLLLFGFFFFLAAEQLEEAIRAAIPDITILVRDTEMNNLQHRA
jgi:hypothetical protein